MLAVIWLTTMIVPVVTVLAGLLLLKAPPAERNALFGYRTNRSRISQQTWDYANKRYGKLAFRFGFLSMVCCVLINLLWTGEYDALVLIDLIPGIFFLIFPIFIVENEIKCYFDKEGLPYKERNDENSEHD